MKQKKIFKEWKLKKLPQLKLTTEYSNVKWRSKRVENENNIFKSFSTWERQKSHTFTLTPTQKTSVLSYFLIKSSMNAFPKDMFPNFESIFFLKIFFKSENLCLCVVDWKDEKRICKFNDFVRLPFNFFYFSWQLRRHWWQW
jgi:hypothetical protein